MRFGVRHLCISCLFSFPEKGFCVLGSFTRLVPGYSKRVAYERFKELFIEL